MQFSAQNRDERMLHDANDRSNIAGDFFYNFVSGPEALMIGYLL